MYEFLKVFLIQVPFGLIPAYVLNRFVIIKSICPKEVSPNAEVFKDGVGRLFLA